MNRYEKEEPTNGTYKLKQTTKGRKGFRTTRHSESDEETKERSP
jgi:hypothetical protein